MADGRGNLVSDGQNSYGYSVDDRLVSASSAGGTSLTYDALGRLFQVTSGQYGTRQFLYDGAHVAAEYDGAGNMTHRWFWASGSDEPVLEDAGGQLNCSGTRFLHGDERGSIVALADCWGNRQGVNSYDEHGIPGPNNAGRFGYTGQMWMPELGMWWYKARVYSPTLGRFMQTDPIGYADGLNAYAYVANDPVNHADPTGLAGQDGLEMRVRQDEQDLLAHRITEQEFRDRQQARGVGGLIGAGLAAAVVAAPEVATAVAARAGFVASRGALAAAENGGEAALQRTAQGAVTTIRNIISNNGTLSDFVGAARESRGVQTGFDHVTEMRQSITGLERASRSLGGSLRNPNLSSEVRGAMQGWKNAADTAIKQMRKILD